MESSEKITRKLLSYLSDVSVQNLTKLRRHIANQPESVISSFAANGGCEKIFSVLSKHSTSSENVIKIEDDAVQSAVECLRILKAMMRCDSGLDYISLSQNSRHHFSLSMNLFQKMLPS